MSVINNVLKDLESKPSAFKPLDLNAVNQDNRSRLPASIYWLIAPILFLVIASAYYIQRNIGAGEYPASATGFEQPVVDTVVTAEAEPIPESPPPATAITAELSAAPLLTNQLVGLHINETPDFVELSFQMTQSAQSFLRQRKQNRYVFLIRNSDSQITAPQIENSWLKNTRLEQISQDVEIQFDTADGVLVETLHKQQQDDHYWIIRLKKSIAAETPASLTKQPATAAKAAKTTKPGQAQKPADKTIDTTAVSAETNRIKLDIKPAPTDLTDLERLKRAVGQIEARQWAAAEIGLQSLIDSGLDREARINLLSLYQFRQQPVEFERLLSQSLGRYPQDQNLILLDANQLINGRQYSTLVQRYQGSAFNWQILSLVAAGYQRLQQHDKAIDYYQKALQLEPRQPKNWISLAISQEQQADYGRALQSYQMAMRSGPLNDRLSGFANQRIQQLQGKAQ